MSEQLPCDRHPLSLHLDTDIRTAVAEKQHICLTFLVCHDNRIPVQSSPHILPGRRIHPAIVGTVKIITGGITVQSHYVLPFAVLFQWLLRSGIQQYRYRLHTFRGREVRLCHPHSQQCVRSFTDYQ